jgi:transcriptional regulator with XRE-family HTH domain
MKHADLKKELLKDLKFSEEYFKNDPLFKVGRQIKEIRIGKGLTQAELAQKMNTKQSSIARIESGNGGRQTGEFLKKFADVVGIKFNPPSFSEFENLNDIKSETSCGPDNSANVSRAVNLIPLGSLLESVNFKNISHAPCRALAFNIY